MARTDLDRDLSLLPGADTAELPAGVDRRAFIQRSAVAGAAAVLTGCAPPREGAATGTAAAQPPAGPASEDGLAVSVTLC